MASPRPTKPRKARANKAWLLTKSLHSPLHEAFVEMIRDARLQAGLSQIDAANQLGVRQSFISDIERGERRVDVVEFVKFCRAYRIDPGTFFEKLKRRASRL